jgi:hypothetical protein
MFNVNILTAYVTESVNVLTPLVYETIYKNHVGRRRHIGRNVLCWLSVAQDLTLISVIALPLSFTCDRIRTL